MVRLIRFGDKFGNLPVIKREKFVKIHSGKRNVHALEVNEDQSSPVINDIISYSITIFYLPLFIS